MKNKLLVIFGSLLAVLLLDREALAWGPGVHMATGSYALANLGLLLPQIAEILRNFPNHFLYGCLSPDIFIGKSYFERSAGSHDWALGQRLLKEAASPSEVAYAYGYLSHLAADTIAHNFFVPRILSATRRNGRLSHLYWELRFEQYVKPSYLGLAREIMSNGDPRADLLLMEVLGLAETPFLAKKQLLLGTIKLYETQTWNRSLAFLVRNSRWQVSSGKAVQLKALVTEAVMDFLKRPAEAACLDYSPLGPGNGTRRRWLGKQG